MQSPANNWPRFVTGILAGFLFLAFSSDLALAASPDPSADESLEADILLGAARNAVKLGDLDTALQRFREFRRRYPDREDGRREYADALFQAGRAGEAMPEYERLLKLHPDDPQLIRTLVDALLQLGDHPRAKRQLVEGIERFPDRLDFAVSLALLYALDGETSAAEEIVRKSILGRELVSRRERLDATALYIQLRRPADARPILGNLLKSDPDDAQVLALSVRYALLTGNRREAVQQADKLDRLYPGNIDLRLELASALYAAGDYAQAGTMFADVLRKSPRNRIALLGCTRVALQDYRVERADALLAQVPDDLRGRQWQLAVSERDTIAGNYCRARQVLAGLLRDDPGDRQASMAMADLNRAENEFIKADTRYLAQGADAGDSMTERHYSVSLYLQCRYCDAERACREVLELDPTDTRTMTLLARILVKTGRCGDAAALVRNAQTIGGNGVLAECVYFCRLWPSVFGDCANGSDSRPVYLAATLVDLAMEDGRRDWAKTILDTALRDDPNNAVLLTRLAEWHASFGVPDQACRAAAIYEDLLKREPSNEKWLLGLARANVTMRCYDRALSLYRKLRCQSPENYLYSRETARVVFFVCGSPKGLAEYDAVLSHWCGLAEESRRIEKERLAKSTHFSSPSVAAGAYESLLRLEPYEQHIAFELGQVRGMLGTTVDAIGAYDHLLSVNPNHRDAQVAIEGKRLQQCQEVLFDHRFARERGRDGLTSIDRLGEYVSYQFARQDENEHLSIGYGRLSLAPTSGYGTTGDAVAVRYQKQIHGDFGPLLSSYVPMAVFVNCEVQNYQQLISTRPVFEAGIKCHTWNDVVWTVSATMENVLENGESLVQDIYRGGLHTQLDYKPCNYWETQALYDFQGYSDDNTRHAAEFRNRFQLTPDPRRISLLADCYYWNFAQASVFNPGPDPFLDMLHPYWTPLNYVMGGIGVEWKQWLSWDRFDGAQHCWVAFSLMKRWDNQEANYTVYRGTLGWDITRCLSGYAMGEYNEGSPYQGLWAYGGFAWRF
jgi:predicted Zn-dependent protease